MTFPGVPPGLQTTGGHSITSPATILGAAYHSDFRSDDPFRVMHGSDVSALYNYGGDASDALASALNEPTYGAATFNGGPGITFNDVDDFMVATFNTPLLASSRPYMFLVAELTGPTSVRVPACLTEGGLGAGNYFFHESGNIKAVRKQDGATFDIIDSGVALGTTRRLVELGFTAGGTATLVVSGGGTNAAHDYVPSANLTKLILGGDETGVFCAGMVFARLIVASSVTAGQISSMRTYLNGANFPNFTGGSYGL